MILEVFSNLNDSLISLHQILKPGLVGAWMRGKLKDKVRFSIKGLSVCVRLVFYMSLGVILKV